MTARQRTPSSSHSPQRMESELGARFLPLHESGPFHARDFSDLLHLRQPAARRLTAATLRRMRSILELDSQ